MIFTKAPCGCGEVPPTLLPASPTFAFTLPYKELACFLDQYSGAGEIGYALVAPRIRTIGHTL